MFKIFKLKLRSKEIALEENESWWDTLSRQEQINYLKEHKNSKFKGKVKPAYEDETKSKEDREALKAAIDDGVSIPPAWVDIEYFGKEGKNGVIAFGTDSQGRRQRVEKPEFREARIKEKHKRIREELSPKFPKIIRNLRAKAKDGDEAALVLYMLMRTGFRIGDKEGSSKIRGVVFQTYGGSSLLAEHVKVDGTKVHFNFLGKGGVLQEHTLRDPLLANAIKEKLETKEPTDKLFDTNVERIRDEWKSQGGDKVHDIRSHLATEEAKKVLETSEKPTTKREAQTLIRKAAEAAAKKLGNRPAESLRTYIDQTIFEGLDNE